MASNLITEAQLHELKRALNALSHNVARLINRSGTSELLDGIVVERFDNIALVHTYSPQWAAASREISTALEDIGVSEAVLWNRHTDPKETTKLGAEVILGQPPESLPVEVDGVKLLLKPFKTASGGIFLDTRDIRRELIAESRGKRVLNLFCFTGSLGIAAAVGGAREVIQVDISQSILEWAKENAALNSQITSPIKYFTDDALDVLGRCVRRREKGTDAAGFDIIIIDPPAFGTTGGKRFDLSAQISELLDYALKAVAVSGRIYLMCNETSILPEGLMKMVPSNLKVKKIRAPLETHPGSLEELSVMRGIRIDMK